MKLLLKSILLGIINFLFAFTLSIFIVSIFYILFFLLCKNFLLIIFLSVVFIFIYDEHKSLKKKDFIKNKNVLEKEVFFRKGGKNPLPKNPKPKFKPKGKL